MRLIKCHIENFGKLSDRTFVFEKGCNVFTYENGWGKSTLAAFVKTMFFGFENETKRDSYENKRKRYEPWQGGVYGGELIFETHEGRYIVSRIFGRTARDDVFELRDADTNNICDRYSERIGEEIFQIDGESFSRTVFLSQKDCETWTTGSIEAKIGNITQNTDDINGYEKAMGRINVLINQMSPNRKTGALKKLKLRIAELENKVRKSEYIQSEIHSLNQKIIETEAQKESILKEQKRLLALQSEISSKKDLQVKCREYELLKKNLEISRQKLEDKKDFMGEEIPSEQEADEYISIWNEVAQERSRLEKEYRKIDRENSDYNGKNASNRRSHRTAAYLCIIFGILLTVFIVGIPLLIAGIYMLRRVKTEGEAHDAVQRYDEADVLEYELTEKENYVLEFLDENGYDMSEKLPWNVILNTLYELRSNISAYMDCMEVFEEYDRQLEAFEKINSDILMDITDYSVEHMENHSLADIGNTIKKTGQLLENTGIKLNAFKQQLSTYTRELSELDAAMDELKDIRKQYDDLREKYRLLELTVSFLSDAKDTFSAKYTEPVKRAFDRYYQMLTGENADRYMFDSDKRLTVMEAGLQRNSIFFSAGCRDLMGICMRMALIDVMYSDDDFVDTYEKNERPFIIMDDPFVNLDSDRYKMALAFLEKVSEKYQLIYFSARGD